jgi:phosphoribosylformylglycinamidine synthase
VKRALAFGGIAAGLGLLAYALFSGETDEEQIRRRLDELAAVVEVQGERQNVAVRGLQLKGKFRELFEKNVTATIPELGSARSGRTDLAALAARSTVYFDSLDLDFDDVSVSIAGGTMTARVESTVVMTAVRRGRTDPSRDERHVRFRFFKDEEHGWRISSVKVGDAEDVAE